MEIILHLFGFYAVLLSNSLCASKKNSFTPYTYEPCSEAYRPQQCLALKCQKKHVMYDVSIMGGVSGLDGDCWGNTSGLIVDTLNCFWEPECKVQFPRQRMLIGLFSDSKSSSDCIYQFPEKIQVVNMKCARKRDVYDICSGKRLKKKGVIRSHGYNTPFGSLTSYSKYPWNYPRHDNETIQCSLTLKAIKSSKALFVTVLKSDFVEEDSLTIGGSVVNTNQRDYKFDKFDKDKNIEFTLRVGPRHQKGYEVLKSGSGFVLCFKEDKIKKRRYNVCESISKRSMKNNTISQVGPRTKQCLLADEKSRASACCCRADACTQDLVEADGFKRSIPSNKPGWEKCDVMKARFPCDC